MSTIFEAIKTICKPLEGFGISTFANARVNHLRQFSTINNNPEYARHYIQEGFYHADISADSAKLDLGDYLMWDLVDCNGKTREMLNAAFDFGYKHIFTIIKNRKEHTDYYHFGTHLTNPAINHWYLNNIDKLELFINYFDEKMISTGLNLAHTEVYPVLIRDCQIATSCLEVSKPSQEFVEHMVPSHFSPRQKECMPLIIQGLSAKEIAKVLEISHRTVEDYIQVLKQKLHAKNKSDLIAKILHIQKLI
jgi:DNA-binding CsgD family transcriptional regulator